MSSTDTIATTASDPTAVVATAQFLTPVVLGLQALTINAKQAHWHVRGANFVGVHELLDTIAATRAISPTRRRNASSPSDSRSTPVSARSPRRAPSQASRRDSRTQTTSCMP